MKAETYTEALQHAWRMTWHHKRLWALGLLAAFIGSAGALEFVAKFYSTVLGERSEVLSDSLKAAVSIDVTTLGWVFAAVLIVVTIAVFALFVAIFVSAQGGLVYAVEQAETQHTLNIASLFHHGRARLWRLFVFNFVKAILVVALLYLSGLMARSLRVPDAPWWYDALFLLGSVVIIVVGLTVSLLAIYAVCYVSLHNKSLKAAFLDAWALFVDHWLVSLEMAVILFVFGAVVSILAVAGLLFLATPVFAGLVTSVIVGKASIVLIGIAIGSVLLLIWVLWLAAVYTTFAMSAWTVLFMQMSRHGFSSRMLHWIKSHLS